MSVLQHPDYNSPLALKDFMEKAGMAMQKKFGQNFLVNSAARVKLIDSLDIDKETTVWEVGPGLGAMTSEILSRGAKLTCFEIDRGFASFVNKFFSDYEKTGHFFLVEGDVLKTWKKYSLEHGVPQRFFGNLPYNVASTIIADTIESGTRFEKALVTVQKEVAQRMTAKPGEDDYSSFSVLCQWAYNVSNVLDLAGGNFWPKPKVASRAVLMEKKKDFPCCKEPLLFMKMQRALFANRRKTIKNNLTQFLSNAEKASEALSMCSIKENLRAEVLPIPQLLSLSDAIVELKLF